MVEYVNVARSGDSLVISLPPSVRAALGIAWRDRLRLVVEADVLVITRIDPNDEARETRARLAKR